MEYWFRGDADEVSHGPAVLLQVLGRDLSGRHDGDTLPFLNSDGEVVFGQMTNEINVATTHLAGSIGYGVQYRGFALNASIGIMQTLSVSGDEIVHFPEGLTVDPGHSSGWEPLDDGNSYRIERFDDNDVQSTQVIFQTSLTYTLSFDRFGIEFGPCYGHTFSSSLTRAAGPNPSIDDLGGVIKVKFEL